MKFFLFLILVSVSTQASLKGNFFSNNCGCDITLPDTRLDYTPFNKIAYAELLTRQIELFHLAWTKYFSKVSYTDENLFGVKITSISSEKLKFEPSGQGDYKPKLFSQIQQTVSNVNFDVKKLGEIQSYFKNLNNEDNTHSLKYLKEYLLLGNQKDSIIKNNAALLLENIELIKSGNGDQILNVINNSSLEQSITGFKVNVEIQSKFGQAQLSFLMAYYLKYKNFDGKVQFEHQVYFQEIKDDGKSLDKYTLNFDKAVEIERYFNFFQKDSGTNHFKKLNVLSFYDSLGLFEIQQSCRNAAAGFREGIGAALSSYFKIYYGTYNVCFPSSILSSNQKINSINQNSYQNLFSILKITSFIQESNKPDSQSNDSFHKRLNYYTDNSAPKIQRIIHKEAFVQSVISEDLSLLSRHQTFAMQENDKSDAPWLNFKFGCLTFKEALDYSLQKNRISRQIYVIKHSNFLSISCDSQNTNDQGYLTFRGKKVLKFFFTTQKNKQNNKIEGLCFRSQFLIPQMLKSSVYCLKKPSNEELQILYQKNNNYQIFYDLYYRQPIDEISNVVIIIDEMSKYALDINIVFDFLINPLIAKNAAVKQGKTQPVSNKPTAPLILQKNAQNFVEKRGMIINLAYEKNMEIPVRLEIIEGEEDFFKLVIAVVDKEKEFLISKFLDLQDFKLALGQQNTSSAVDLFKKYLEENYQKEIIKFLEDNFKELNSPAQNQLIELNSEGYRLDISASFIQKYASYSQISCKLAIGIAMYQLVQTKFVDEVSDQKQEDNLYKPVIYSQQDIDLSKGQLKSNFKNIMDKFVIQIKRTLDEDSQSFESYFHEPKISLTVTYYESNQEYSEKMLSEHNQSYWVFLQDKNEPQRLGLDNHLYFQLKEVVPFFVLTDQQRLIFIESFVEGLLKNLPTKDLHFLLGNREVNRFVIVSFECIENQHLRLLQISFYSLYFSSQFLVQLNDFASVWERIFSIIVSVSLHYKELAAQSFDMTPENYHFDLKQIEDWLAELLKDQNLEVKHIKIQQNGAEVDSLIFLSKNYIGEQTASFKDDDLKYKKIVLSVNPKKFKNQRKGFVLKIYDSKLPKEEKDQKKGPAVHSQLEFYDSYNFDYSIVLKQFIMNSFPKLPPIKQ